MSEFDDFAIKHAQARENSNRLAQDTRPEWAILKQEASLFSQDKEFDGRKFEWAPYKAYYPDFLRLDNVAATFVSRETPGSTDYRIRFTRRAAEPGRMWHDEESPLNTIEWSLKTVIEGDNILWVITGSDEKYKSAALVDRIAVELSKYHLAYKRHYDNWLIA
jgi:hypothetical protein